MPWNGWWPDVDDPVDWAPLAELVAVDDFERVGTFLEVQNWSQYTEMLTRWASATDSFETIGPAHLRVPVRWSTTRSRNGTCAATASTSSTP